MSVSDASYLWECDRCFDAEETDSDNRLPSGWEHYKGRDLCESCHLDVQDDENLAELEREREARGWAD